MGKVIALFIDGTRNEGEKCGVQEETNVWRLFRSAGTQRSPTQLVKYIRGVGVPARKASRAVRESEKRITPSRFSKVLRRRINDCREMTINAGLGRGCVERMQTAYAFLARNYEPGDSVFLFGFSRGAFIARLVAGFTAQVGMLLKSAAIGRDRRHLMDRAARLYLVDPQGQDGELRQLLRRFSVRAQLNDMPRLPIHFVGVWDTVAATRGREKVSLAGTTYSIDLRPRYEALKTVPANVTHARHALALHELRKLFEPLEWSGCHDKPYGQQTLVQVWFPGAHADIGGGYREGGLSQLPLSWMANEASQMGLCLTRDALEARTFSPQRPHDELHGVFFATRPTVRTLVAHLGAPNATAHPSYFVHVSACRQLLDADATAYERRTYPYERAWPTGLHDPCAVLPHIDTLAAGLHMTLLYRHGKWAIGESNQVEDKDCRASLPWWDEFATFNPRASGRLARSMFDNNSLLSDAEAESLARALTVLVAFGGTSAVDSMRQRAVERHKGVLESASGGGNPEVAAWYQRLQSVSTVLATSKRLLPVVYNDLLDPLLGAVTTFMFEIHQLWLRRDKWKPRFRLPQ
jgi:uncharacterized protein (DUF2235 family)